MLAGNRDRNRAEAGHWKYRVGNMIRNTLQKALIHSPVLSRFVMSLCPFTDRGDTVWSQVNFAHSLKRWPDLDNVPGFNDGLLRVKLAERDDPLRHHVADKLKFKAFARDRLGPDHVVPLIDVIRDQRGLQNYRFPGTCVIKPTNASGIYKLRRDGEPLDLAELHRFFHCNHYRFSREKFYRYIPSGLIVEEYVPGSDGPLPMEYKVFCFFGRAKIIQWTDRSAERGLIKRWYTPQWRPLEFTILRELGPVIPRPPFLANLVAMAETMSEGFTAIRADFFMNGDRIMAGELTNVDGNASKPFYPDPAAELKLGRLFTDPMVTVDDLIDC